MKADAHGHNQWAVQWFVLSDSGTMYVVSYVDLGDGDPDWSCTCPAAEYNTVCEHVRAVIHLVHPDAEEA
ncbi:MAG TPA: SWIM zinc finger family protein [Anaerolineae bacterium]|nr:SWIM zinc finger family protein [Anaerolineae bacterium]